MYLRAYAKLYKNKGAMTPGTTGETVDGHCQLIEKIPNKWVKHLTAALLTPCILVYECQGKSQEIGYLPLS